MIPDNVEKIIMTKEDYDRNVEQMLVDKCKAELELDKYKNIVDELEQHLEAMIRIYENEYKSIEDAEHYRSVLDKLKKLKGE